MTAHDSMRLLREAPKRTRVLSNARRAWFERVMRFVFIPQWPDMPEWVDALEASAQSHACPCCGSDDVHFAVTFTGVFFGPWSAVSRPGTSWRLGCGTCKSSIEAWQSL